MNFKLTQLPSFSSGTESKDCIYLSLADVPARHREYYLQVKQSDITFVTNTLCIPAHRFILSQFCQKYLESQSPSSTEADKSVFILPEKINIEIFQSILSCVYGLETCIDHSQGVQALKIAALLQIQLLLDIMKADAFQNFDKYELFPLLDAADLVGMTDIVDLCLSHLEEDAYEPIRFSKFDFINCRESVFRNVILSLNDSKFEDPQMGIPDAAIIETINDYCKHNFYSEEKRSQMLKELIHQPFSPPGQVRPKRPKKMTLPSTPEYLSRYKIQINCRNKTEEDNPFESMIEPSTTPEFITCSKSMCVIRNRNRSSTSSEPPPDTQNLFASLNKIKESQINLKKSTQQMKQQIQSIEGLIASKIFKVNDQNKKLNELEAFLLNCDVQLKRSKSKLNELNNKVNRFQSRRERDSRYNDEGLDSDDSRSSNDSIHHNKDRIKGKEDLSVDLTCTQWIQCEVAMK